MYSRYSDAEMIHLIKEIDQINTCPHCRNSLEKSKFKSEFIEHFHYKTTVCKCGEKIWISLGTNGSGHDNWNHKIRQNNSIENLEEVLQPKSK